MRRLISDTLSARSSPIFPPLVAPAGPLNAYPIFGIDPRAGCAGGRKLDDQAVPRTARLGRSPARRAKMMIRCAALYRGLHADSTSRS